MAATKWMALGAVMALASGCMTYRGPRGVEAALEGKLGVELHRELGIKLGPISTQFAASFVGHDEDVDLHDLSRVSVVVFEVGARRGSTRRPVEPADLRAKGWSTMLDSRDGDDQVLLLVKLQGGTIHDMIVLAVDGDEVVVARLTGRLDALIARAMNGAKHDGARGARAAVGFGGE